MELAFVLPLLVSVMLGTVASCRMLYLRQSAKLAAYEAARLSITPGASVADCDELAGLILEGRHVEGHAYACSVANLSQLQYGQSITSTVRFPVAKNALLPSILNRGRVIEESVTIMVEYTTQSTP